MAQRDTLRPSPPRCLRRPVPTPRRSPSWRRESLARSGVFHTTFTHVVDQLDQLRRPLGLDDVSSAVDTLVYDPHDPANLNYYVTRLSSYYADEDRVARLGRTRHHGRPGVADTRPGAPQSVQTPRSVAGGRAASRSSDGLGRGPLHRTAEECRRSGVRLPLAARQEMVEGAAVMRHGFLRSSRYSPGKHGIASLWRPSSSGVVMKWKTCCPASQRRYEARRNTTFSWSDRRGSGKTHFLALAHHRLMDSVRRRRHARRRRRGSCSTRKSGESHRSLTSSSES